jgi:signal transduction histidine kinase
VFWIFQKLSDLVLEKPEVSDLRTASPKEITATEIRNPLDEMVHDVVDQLGYVGAMVALYEPGDVLPVKAAYFDSSIPGIDRIPEWEKELSEFTPRPISLTNPEIARVRLFDPDHRVNLSAIAFHSEDAEIRDNLFSLFTPFVPPEAEGLVNFIQEQLGIKQVIAVPFFIETRVDGQVRKDFVGNLFAAKGEAITEEDKELLSSVAYYLASFILSEKRRLQVEIIGDLTLDMQRNLRDETRVLERIVQGVVEELGYAGAMVATYEAGETLPVRSLYINPELAQIATKEKIREWEQQASEFTGEPLSLTDPNIARVYPKQDKYKDNLSAIAFKSEEPEISDSLFSLFTPIAPPESEGLINFIQQHLGIKHVIAVPFFIETEEDGEIKKEFVGNLFAATRSKLISSWEIEILKVFGQQAAVGLRNVRLYRQVDESYRKADEAYRKAEDRRKATEIFGKMAFTASASVHALRNHMSVIGGTLQLISMLNSTDENSMRVILDEIIKTQQITRAVERSKQMTKLIESLHKPSEVQPDQPVEINACIRRAIARALKDEFPPDQKTPSWVELNLAPEDLFVTTLPEMMTEAFHVLIKNAYESMSGLSEKYLKIESRLDDDLISVTIEDHGAGIAQENIDRIFEMRYTTKKGGLGFGLFWTKDFIEGLRGTIDVTSDIGQGTKFTVTLPSNKHPDGQTENSRKSDGQ